MSSYKDFKVGLGVKFNTSNSELQSELDRYAKNLSVKTEIGVDYTKAQADAKDAATKIEKILSSAYKEATGKDLSSNDAKRFTTKYLKEYISEINKATNASNKFVSEQRKLSTASSLSQWAQNNTKALKQFGDNINTILSKLRSGTDVTNEEFKQLQSTISTMKLSARDSGNLGMTGLDKLTNAWQKFGGWAFATGSITATLSKIKDAESELININSILTEISKTNDTITKQGLIDLGKESFSRASDYGRNASDYLTGVQEMNRSGYYGERGNDMAELSIKAQSAGDLTADVANSYLLATNAAYRYNGEISKLNDVLDGQNEVTNRNSVSMNDMAEATSRAASTANTTGVSIEKLSAIIGTIEASTKEEGATVGTGIKSLLINLQNSSSKKIVSTLEEAGASMTELKDGIEQMRNPIEILKDLQKTFNSLDEKDPLKSKILTNIGQKYHANELSALLSNWDQYEKMLGDYADGGGSAEEEAKKSANNIEGSLNKLSNTWTSTVSNFQTSDGIKTAINSLNGLLGVVNDITDILGSAGSIGALGGLIASATGNGVVKYSKDDGFTTWLDALKTKIPEVSEEAKILFSDLDGINLNSSEWNDYLKQIDLIDENLIDFLNDTKYSEKTLSSYETYLKDSASATTFLSKASQTAGVAIKSVGAAIASMGITMLISEGISLAIKGIDNLVHASEHAKEAMQEAFSSIEEAQSSLQNVTNTISDNRNKFIELSKGVSTYSENINLSSEDYSEYLSISNDLAEISPSLVTGYDEQGNALLKIGKNAEETSKLLDDMIKKQQEIATQTVLDNMDEVARGVAVNVREAGDAIAVLQSDMEKAYSSSLNIDLFDSWNKSGGIALDGDNLKYEDTIKKALKQAGIDFENADNQVMSGKFISFDGFSDDQIQQAQAIYDDLLEIEQTKFDAYKNDLSKQLSTQQGLIDEYYDKMASSLSTWTKNNYKYTYLSNLDDNFQGIVDQAVGNIDWNEIFGDNAPMSSSAYENWIEENLLDPLLSVPDKYQGEIGNSFKKLLSFEDGDLNILPFAEELEKRLNELGININITPIIAEEKDAKDRLQNDIKASSTHKDMYGRDEVDNSAYSKLAEYTKNFTVEQVETWLKVTSGLTDADEKIAAFENHIKSASIASSSFSDTFNSDDFEKTKENLLKLANAGELSDRTLKSTKEYKDLLDETGLTAKEACAEIYNMVDANTRLDAFSSNMGNLDKAYANFKTNGNNTSSDFSGIESAFGDLSSYQNFINIAGNAKSSVDQIQQSYNKLVGEYIESTGILDIVTEKNKGRIQTELEALGVENAEQIVTAALTGDIITLTNAKETLANFGYTLENVTSKEINALIREGKISNDTAVQIANFALKKQAANASSINTNGDINNLAALANVGGKVGKILERIAQIKENISKGVGAPAAAMQSDLDDLQKQLEKQLNKGTSVNYNVSYSGGDSTSSAINKANNSASKATKTVKKFSESIDWSSKSIDTLNNKISKLQSELENTNGYDKQISKLKQILSANTKLEKSYSKQEKSYENYYNKLAKKYASVYKKYKNKIENGETFSIENFKNEKTYNKVTALQEAYENWQSASTSKASQTSAKKSAQNAVYQKQVDKYNAAIDRDTAKLENASGYKEKNRLTENILANQIKSYNYQIKMTEDTRERIKLQEELETLKQQTVLDEIGNIQADFDNKMSLIDAEKNSLQADIDLASAMGKVSSAEYYKELNQYSADRMNQLLEERIQIKNQASTLRPYTNAWYEAQNAVSSLDSAIAEETQNMVENVNKQIDAMNELRNKIFDVIDINANSDFITSLFDTDSLTYENGLTDQGKTVVASKYTNIQGNMEKLNQLREDRKTAKNTLTDAKYQEYYIDSLKEEQDLVSDTKTLYDDINDIVISGYEAQKDALDDIIEKKKSSIQLDKDEYDFQKDISDKTKEISDINKQLAMLKGNNSEEANAQRQSLQNQANEKQKDLDETLYNKYIDRVENALDDMSDRLATAIEKLSKQMREDGLTEEQISSAIGNVDATTIIDDALAMYGGDSNTVNSDLIDKLTSNGDISKALSDISQIAENTYKEEKDTETTTTTVSDLESAVSNLLSTGSSLDTSISGRTNTDTLTYVNDGLESTITQNARTTSLSDEQMTEIRKSFKEAINMANIVGNSTQAQTVSTLSTKGLATQSCNIDSVNFTFDMPNVTDSKSMIKAIQSDTSLQKTLQNATIGQLQNTSVFKVNRL